MASVARPAAAPARRAAVSPASPAHRGRPRPQPPLRVVPPVTRRRRAGLVALAVVAGVFAVMLGLTALQTKIAQGQQRLDRLEREYRSAQAYNERLRLAVAQLESPSHVQEEARRLGLRSPAPEQIVYVTPAAEAVGEVAAASVAGISEAP